MTRDPTAPQYLNDLIQYIYLYIQYQLQSVPSILLLLLLYVYMYFTVYIINLTLYMKHCYNCLGNVLPLQKCFYLFLGILLNSFFLNFSSVYSLEVIAICFYCV